MDNFGLSPFQVSNKSGLRLDTALSELGFVSKEQFNDPYFSQEDLVKDFLRKYNTNEKRKEFLDYDIDQKFIERLTPEEQIEENIASYLSKKYYDTDGFPIYDAIEKNADKILKETGANKEQLDNFIKAQKEIENEIVSFNIEDFKDPPGDGYLVPIDNLIKRGILNERDIESKIENTRREESGIVS